MLNHLTLHEVLILGLTSLCLHHLSAWGKESDVQALQGCTVLHGPRNHAAISNGL